MIQFVNPPFASTETNSRSQDAIINNSNVAIAYFYGNFCKGGVTALAKLTKVRMIIQYAKIISLVSSASKYAKEKMWVEFCLLDRR